MKAKKKRSIKIQDDNEDYGYEVFDIKKSILPKSLIRKGITCHSWDYYTDKNYLKKRLREEEKQYDDLKYLVEQAKKKLDKKALRIFNREVGWKLRISRKEIKELEDEIKNFNIIYFLANDIEKVFRELLNKK